MKFVSVKYMAESNESHVGTHIISILIIEDSFNGREATRHKPVVPFFPEVHGSATQVGTREDYLAEPTLQGFLLPVKSRRILQQHTKKAIDVFPVIDKHKWSR